MRIFLISYVRGGNGGMAVVELYGMSSVLYGLFVES